MTYELTKRVMIDIHMKHAYIEHENYKSRRCQYLSMSIYGEGCCDF